MTATYALCLDGMLLSETLVPNPVRVESGNIVAVAGGLWSPERLVTIPGPRIAHITVARLTPWMGRPWDVELEKFCDRALRVVRVQECSMGVEEWFRGYMTQVEIRDGWGSFAFVGSEVAMPPGLPLNEREAWALRGGPP